MMIKRIFALFLRDLKVNTREFLSLYILIVPVILAIGINLLAPGINDTTVDLALIEDDNQEMVAYLEQFANIELVEDEEALIKRVEKRDQMIGIVPDDTGYHILAQGNEDDMVIQYAKMVKTYFDLDVSIEETNAVLYDFGKTVPPLKTKLVNGMLLMISVLAGMIISVNIIEEKGDNTISAIHLTPVSRLEYILGKSVIGVFMVIYGSIAMVLITGYNEINIIQLLLGIFSVTLLSMLIGFIEGIKNDDVMSAAGSVKMMFLPIGAAVVAIEILSDKWQILFYWIPFYWTYKGNAAILTGEATWSQILLYTGIVVVLCSAVFALLAPQVKKGLE
jgi:ABC-type Na+ efflux pump permease subunit